MNLIEQYKELLYIEKFNENFEKYLRVPSLIRLKNVGYFCGMDFASKEIYNFSGYVSRYDHSLTVALITWMCTKDKRATLAALFHDISTPCFSHVIDYMNNDYIEQESTEQYIKDILDKDEYLLECLKEDGILLEEIIDFKKYTIVDNKRPKLCADRLDGVILTGLYWTKNLTLEDVKNIIADIEIFINEDKEKEIGFKNEKVAKLVVEVNKSIDMYCHSKEDIFMMELLASITKNAIDKNIITYEDLYKLDEEELMYILEICNDNELLLDLNKFKNIKLDEIPAFDIPNIKYRCLNPLVDSVRLNDFMI